jgi:hypothetical protein
MSVTREAVCLVSAQPVFSVGLVHAVQSPHPGFLRRRPGVEFVQTLLDRCQRFYEDGYFTSSLPSPQPSGRSVCSSASGAHEIGVFLLLHTLRR